MTQNQTLNISSWFSNFKNLKWWQGAILLAILLTGLSAVAYEGGNVNVSANLSIQIQQIENRLDIPVNSTLSAFIKSNSFIVSELDQGFCLQNGTNAAYLPPFTTNSTYVIENGLGNASANGGGSVYVSAGPNLYNASVTLLNQTRFVIEAGAKNITYSVAAGAYCIVDDFQNSIFTYYSNGAPYDIFNYATGNLLTQSANMTTLYVANITGITGNVQIFKLILENGTQFPTTNLASGYLFDCNNTAYYYNGTGWTAWGTGGGGSGTYDYNQLINKPDFTGLVATNGTRPLTANWNTSQGIYGAAFINCTNIYAATIDQLVSGSGVKILDMVVQSGTSFPASPIDKQVFYRSDQGLEYIYNSTGSAWVPVGYTPNSYPYADLTGYPNSLPWGNLTSVPVILYANGSQALTADWSVGGYGVYGASWVNSTSINTNNYYLNGSLLGVLDPDSFLIDSSGGNTRAWYGANSTLAFQGTNASQIITWAVNNLTAYSYTFTGFGGGTIYLKGQFQISNTIFCQLPISIIGVPEGGDSFAKLFANGLNGSMLYFNATGSVDWHWTLANLHLDGVNTTSGHIGTGGPGGNYLLYINLGYGILQNIYVMRGYGTGIFMGGQDTVSEHVYSEFNGVGTGSGDGWYVATLNDQFYSCTGWNNSRYGMYISSGQVRGLFEGCRFAWNLVGFKDVSGASQITIEGSDIFSNYNEGIYLVSADHVTIENNPSILDNGIATNNTYSGIRLSSSVNCTIEGNNIYDDGLQTSGNNMQYAISEDGTSDFNNIKDNNLACSTSGVTFIGLHLIGANDVVRGNLPIFTQDRLLNTNVGQSGWTSALTNLQYAVDGNLSTFTGIGETNASSGHMGYIYLNMGANYSVTFSYLVQIRNNASTLNIQIGYSYDNSTWSPLPNNYYGISSSSYQTIAGGPYYIYAQYIRIDFYFTGATATQFDMKAAEFQAYDYP